MQKYVIDTRTVSWQYKQEHLSVCEWGCCLTYPACILHVFSMSFWLVEIPTCVLSNTLKVTLHVPLLCYTVSFYLHLTGVDMVPAVPKVLHSGMMLWGALIFLVLFLASPCRGIQTIRTESLQKGGHGLGLRQLGNLEVLLVVRCVFSDQALLLHRKGRPLILFITPITIFPILLFILISSSNYWLFCKVHSWLEKRA